MEQKTDNEAIVDQEEEQRPNEAGQLAISGHIKIFDPNSGEVIVDKRNAIHYENISESIANSLANKAIGQIYSMSFGNGGSSVDPTGVITYLPPNTTGQNANLYNPTYSKVVDDNSASNTDTSSNNLTITHTTGKVYSDILVSCLLDYGEPSGQQAFTWNGSATDLRLITHVIFHPVQKSLNRQIQIDYTVRIQTLTNLSAT
jgi:hypothetical protein